MNKMNNEELERYRNGFKVAINFLYHHQATDDDKTNFEKLLNEHMDAEVVQEAINLRNNVQEGDHGCPPGLCFDGSGCVPCKFEYAFDGKYHL